MVLRGEELLKINYEDLGESDAIEYEKDLNEVLDLARQALEQPTSDDCASRQAVLDLMQLKMGGRELYKAVYDLPPVTPTRKVGKWIKTSGSFFICSECMVMPEFIDIRTLKYCPNCAAEMRGNKDGI